MGHSGAEAQAPPAVSMCRNLKVHPATMGPSWTSPTSSSHVGEVFHTGQWSLSLGGQEPSPPALLQLSFFVAEGGCQSEALWPSSQAWQRCANLSEASAMTGFDIDALSQYLDGTVCERQYSTGGEYPLLRLNPGVDAMANSLGTRFIARWEDSVEGAGHVAPVVRAPPAMANASATPAMN